MTKPMATVAALQLYERGKLLIDDPLAKYFPNFAEMQVAELNASGDTITGKVPAMRPITLRHLMMHTSGLIYGGRGNTAVHKLYPGGSSIAGAKSGPISRNRAAAGRSRRAVNVSADGICSSPSMMSAHAVRPR